MNILYIGDVMAEPGMQVLEKVLPKLRQEKQIDVVIAQAENTTDGKGITPDDFKRLLKAGVDFCTGGNWTLHQDSIFPALSDPQQPIVRPANYPVGTPGKAYKILPTNSGNILIVSLMGKIVGRDADVPVENPLSTIDQIIQEAKTTHPIAAIVNLHGDFSSEKVVIGHYLDGRASLVVGDHWHVPTADARILPGGTAHQTDVGMCGVLDSSLGVSYDSIIPRWRDNKQTRNVLETKGPYQFNAVLVCVNDNGLADSVEPIRQIL